MIHYPIIDILPISRMISYVSDSIIERVNTGAYEQPFSGVGVEFDPLGLNPDRQGVTLHETGYIVDNARWNFPGVFSPFWRLHYNESRGHCMLFGDRMVELVPGVVILIPPHCLFHCLGGNPVPTFWMAFSFSRRIHAEAELPLILPARDTDRCLIRDLSRLVSSNPDGKPSDAIYRNSLALVHVSVSRPELRWQPHAPERFSKVISYIERHLQTKFSCEALAKMAGMSLPSFNRTFRTVFGASLAQYIMRLRVREASRLLLRTEQTIESIAETTGFPNRAYFSRVFLRSTGEPPASFRRRCRFEVEPRGD